MFRELDEESKYKALHIGRTGYTPDCLLAIDAILNSGRLPEKATLVSTPPHARNGQLHLFLFWNWWHFPLTIVPSGFKDGYSGEGARGFSLAICMIRSKNIPIYWFPIEPEEFMLIDRGKILEPDHPIFKKIQLESEILTWPWSLWVPEKDEELFQREQLWRKYYWREAPTDWLTEAIANIDLYDQNVGRKLRLARNTLLGEEEIEAWQGTGILIRDAWIELMQNVCSGKIDISGISPNDVKRMLRELEINEAIVNSASSVFNLSLKIQHDRKIRKEVAVSCTISTALFMQVLLLELGILREREF